jgi:hypothetical protein
MERLCAPQTEPSLRSRQAVRAPPRRARLRCRRHRTHPPGRRLNDQCNRAAAQPLTCNLSAGRPQPPLPRSASVPTRAIPRELHSLCQALSDSCAAGSLLAVREAEIIRSSTQDLPGRMIRAAFRAGGVLPPESGGRGAGHRPGGAGHRRRYRTSDLWKASRIEDSIL